MKARLAELGFLTLVLTKSFSGRNLSRIRGNYFYQFD